MKELRILLLRPKNRSAVLGFLTVLIGLTTNFAASYHFPIWWILLIILVFMYIFALVKYSEAESNLVDEIEGLKTQKVEYEKRILVFSRALQGITAMNRLSSKQTNLRIHEIIEDGRLRCDNWNFEIASSLLCKEIHTHLISHLVDTHLFENNEYNGIVDIEIAYVSLVEKQEKGKKKSRIKLCGFYHPTKSSPSLYNENRSILRLDRDRKLYHDAELFIRSKSDVDILLTPEEINIAFASLPANHDYCQYIGIPVMCEASDDENKMVGLLEIVCHNDCIISDDIDTIKSYVANFFQPYASLFLLLFKCDKALRAMPKCKN